MIPSDLAARLRFLHEASLFETSPPVGELQRTREIQTQLQELLPGRRFLATLQRTLPDGTFRALVAGQQVTLALNASAQPGDTLELIATDVTPKMVLSRLASDNAALAGSARSNLSPTGQLISFLLTGQPAAKPATLANGTPFIGAPPATANTAAQTASSTQIAAGAQIGINAQLAPMLRQALAQSGLFYESHLVQWLAGKIDLATLAREPQTQGMQPPGQPPASSAGTASAPASAANTGAASSAQTPGSTGAAAGAANAAVQALARQEEPVARITGQPADNAPRGPIAERLLPIVHQQLETLASQQYVWHGMAWAGQAFEWIIEDPRGEGRPGGEEDVQEWNTTLRLRLPRLGGVEACVRLNAGGVALRLGVDDDSIAAIFEKHRDELAEALAAAGVPLTGMVVERRDGR
ncbi:MAG: flagellar hook-length control protein FliK [Azoarcus sp.]|jgi:hypothetical protein|nr:flagellar hook-length control protein FliK [Azoarcus sp.]